MELKLLEDKDGNVHLGRGKETLDKFGLEGALLLGRVDEPPYQGKNVYLDSLYPHVIFVCGSRGSGKSYTVGVLLEELAKNNSAVGCVVIDPVGVFWSMKKKNADDKEKETLRDWKLNPEGVPNVTVLVPLGAKEKIPPETFDGTFSLKPAELTVDDWCLTFGLERFDPASLALERAIDLAGISYRIEDLVEVLSTRQELSDKAKGFSKVTIRGLISRLESAKNWGVLSTEQATPIEELSQKNKIVVLDVSFLEEQVASLVVGIIARKILNARKVAARSESLGYTTTTIPPTWLVVDEAHTIAPQNKKTAASEAMIEYVKQGRRPGCSVILATQQPSAIDSQVLSQLDIMVSHKLVFYDDIKSVFKRVPSSVDKKMQEIGFIRNLPLGNALVADREESSSRAFVIKVRPRKSQHEGRSALAVEKSLEQRSLEAAKPKVKSLKKELPALAGWLPKVSLEEASKLAGPALDKKLLVFANEHVLSKRLLHYPVWAVEFTLPQKRMNITVYIDALLGELMELKGNRLRRSRGLLKLIKFPPIERTILLQVAGETEEKTLAKRMKLEEKTLKVHIRKLVKAELLKSKMAGEKTFYRSLEPFELELKSYVGLPENQAVQQEGTILKEAISTADARKITKVFDEDVQIKTAKLLHYPYWLFKTNKRRILVDGLTGQVEVEVGAALPSSL